MPGSNCGCTPSMGGTHYTAATTRTTSTPYRDIHLLQQPGTLTPSCTHVFLLLQHHPLPWPWTAQQPTAWIILTTYLSSTTNPFIGSGRQGLRSRTSSYRQPACYADATTSLQLGVISTTYPSLTTAPLHQIRLPGPPLLDTPCHRQTVY